MLRSLISDTDWYSAISSPAELSGSTFYASIVQSTSYINSGSVMSSKQNKRTCTESLINETKDGEIQQSYIFWANRLGVNINERLQSYIFFQGHPPIFFHCPVLSFCFCLESTTLSMCTIIDLCVMCELRLQRPYFFIPCFFMKTLADRRTPKGDMFIFRRNSVLNKSSLNQGALPTFPLINKEANLSDLTKQVYTETSSSPTPTGSIHFQAASAPQV